MKHGLNLEFKFNVGYSNKSYLIKYAEKLKLILPELIKVWLAKKIHLHIFDRAIKEFIKNSHDLNSNDQLINRLIYGWGNQAYSSRNSYIKALIVYANQTRGPILECGSGLSTILLGIIAQKRGIKIFSLENSNLWGEYLRSKLKRYNINSVRVLINPLKNYGDFDWYNPAIDLLPEKFSLIICDGPPASTLGGRLGLLPILKDRLVNSIILLDDYDRTGEREFVERWERDYNISVEQIGKIDTYAKITVM